MRNTSRDIIRYFSAVAGEEPVYIAAVLVHALGIPTIK